MNRCCPLCRGAGEVPAVEPEPVATVLAFLQSEEALARLYARAFPWMRPPEIFDFSTEEGQ